MTSTTSTPTHGTITTEGCPINYWHIGTGPLVLFVPGGNGHGRQFDPILAALSPRGFTCATFDRRQMSSSQPPASERKKLSVPQQARDIRAVVAALGFSKATVFGSSAGAIFSLQFAHDFPDMVDHVVSHEAPLTNLLPGLEAARIYEWFLHLDEVRRTVGMAPAAAEFRAQLLGYDDEGVPETAPPEPGNRVNFWEYEFASLAGYVPNLWRVRENKTSVGVMRAVRSRDAFFARTVDELAKVLDCPMMMVPGHHQGFEVELDEFLPSLVEMLDVLEKRREGRS